MSKKLLKRASHRRTVKLKRVRLKNMDEKRRDDLTPKQKRFVAEYGIDQNQTQAAIRAGFSERSAPIIAHRLLKKANVARAVQQSMSKHLSRADITAERVLAEIASVAFVEMSPKDVKPSDKLSALGTLARHLGLLVERREVTGQMSILNVNVSQADLESARQLVESFRSEKLIEGETIKDEDEAK